MSATRSVLFRRTILVLAPATLLAGGIYHPWIGTPSNPGFLEALAGAVADGPTRWAAAHLTIAVGSALMMLAFLALHDWLREASGERATFWALPFVVVGSTLYALLPAMEFVPLAAAEAGADAAAAQAALLPWFRPVLLLAALAFAVGVFGFATSIARSGVLKPGSTWLVLAAFGVLAASRFVPVGVAQLYVGPTAGVVALGWLAYTPWKPRVAPAGRSGSAATV